MRYTVTAERGTGVWVFQCVEHPGAISQSRRLGSVYELMPEAIAFVAGVDQADVEIYLVTPEVDALVGALLQDARAKRVESERLAREAAEDMTRAAHALVEEAHLPLRDAGVIMGVSHQRVAQLIDS